MTGEEFVELWKDKDLRQYIVNQARRHSKRRELQEEYVQEAWLCISCAPAGYDSMAYKEIAYRAIYSGYWNDYKNRQPYESLAGIRLIYTTNPFDPREVLINGKTPKRKTSDYAADDDPADNSNKMENIEIS